MVILKKGGVDTPLLTQRMSTNNKSLGVGIVLGFAVFVGLWNFEEVFLTGLMVQQGSSPTIVAVTKLLWIFAAMLALTMFVTGVRQVKDLGSDKGPSYKQQKAKQQETHEEKQALYEAAYQAKIKQGKLKDGGFRAQQKDISYWGKIKEHFGIGKPHHHTTMLGKKIKNWEDQGFDEDKIRQHAEGMGWSDEAVDHYYGEEAKLAVKESLAANEQEQYFNRLKKAKQQETASAQQERFSKNKKRFVGIQKEQKAQAKETDGLFKEMQRARSRQLRTEKNMSKESKKEALRERISELATEMKTEKKSIKQDDFHFVGDSLEDHKEALQDIKPTKKPTYHSNILMKQVRKLKDSGKTNREIRRRLKLMGLWDEEMIEKHLGKV